MIRILHNRSFTQRREDEAAYYKEAFSQADIRKIVGALARSHSANMKNADILIPTRVITIMLENNEGDCTMEEICQLYLREYMENSDVMKIDKMWI